MILVRHLPRLRGALYGLAVLSLVLATACGGEGNASDGGGVIITPIASLTSPTPVDVGPTPGATTAPGATPTAPLPTATPSAPVLSGFIWPIVGGCLPQSDRLMPNAPREYRNGFHEGVDFYDVDNCTTIVPGMDVVAAKSGTVIRADLDFVEMTPAELEENLAEPNTPEALDRFRGRQVWIDHGGGVVTRYAHLDGIVSGISVGTTVEAGEVIAYVGESGTPETITNPGTEYHLHFELRVGNSYLGAGLPPAEARTLYEALFAP
jgi:murein DD-endopeptidase MepM/ murein hydrolase activator NlpD